MKSKTIILFVFGLIGWLLATNYQTVHSKMAGVLNLASEKVESVFDKEKDGEVDASLTLEGEEQAVLDGQSIVETIDAKVEEVANTTEKNAEDSSVELAGNTVEESTSDVQTDLDTDVKLNADSLESTASETGTEVQIAKADDSLQQKNSASTQTSTATAQETTSSTAVTPAMATPYNNMGFPTPNPNMMNPVMYMNPMAMMAPMMMGPMMNPAMMMNPMAMMNHPVNTMTQPQNMNAMMMSMNPEMMFGMFGQPSEAYKNGEVPDQLPVVKIPGFPTQTYQNWPTNKVSPNFSREAKLNAFQTAMAMSPMSMRSMVSMMADKIPVEDGISWDDAVEAMKLRANEVNFKFVGSSPLWKQIEAETEQPSAKVEMFRFCDARMARKILDEVPEFIIFLPCKIALLEDAEGKLWVMTLDWDVSWLDYSQNPNNHLSKDIREHAQLIRKNIQYIMEGAATGDF